MTGCGRKGEEGLRQRKGQGYEQGLWSKYNVVLCVHPATMTRSSSNSPIMLPRRARTIEG
jgi:hypothetical protein